MTDEELIQALREAAIRFEPIVAENAELRRRIDAAERDIQLAADGEICDICTHSGEDAGDKNSACWNCTQGNPKCEWRGPQEAGKGVGE